MTDLLGQILDKYHLKQKLGQGGMGTVYRAFQTDLERWVAVKTLLPEHAKDAASIDRFKREAATAAALEHGNIVPIYDYGTVQNINYVVMRLLTGGSLAHRLEQSIQTEQHLPSPADAAKLLDQLASALDYAHRQGVVHRDLKPSNVMFDDGGTAYLVDFGIAKLMGAVSTTAAGMTKGTPAFMAPEQWRNEGVGPQTDQYSVAIMLYYMLVGKLPFQADTPYGLMYKHMEETPTPAHAMRSDLLPGITEVIERAMAKTPAERYADMASFAAAFRESLTGVSSRGTMFFTYSVPTTAEPPFPSPSGLPQPHVAPPHPSQLPERLASDVQQSPPAQPTTPYPAHPQPQARPPTPYPPQPQPQPPPRPVTPYPAHPLPRPQPPRPAPRRKSRGWLWMLLTLVLVALIAGGLLGGYWIFSSQDDDESETPAVETDAGRPTPDDIPDGPADQITIPPATTLPAPTTAAPTRAPTFTSVPSPTFTPMPITLPDLGGTVLEVTAEGNNLRVREAPSTEATIISRLKTGHRVVWFGDQEAGDDFTWMRVTLYDGRSGYVVQDESWILPADPGQVTPGIGIGAYVVVTVAGSGLEMHDAADLDATTIRALSSGENLQVIGGPVYSQNYLWWFVMRSDGTAGWVVDVPGWLRAA